MKLIWLFFLFLLTSALSANVKTPSDVYSEAIVLKKMILELRLQNGLKTGLKQVERQTDKLPRHVLQKSIEVLRKINKYREIHNMGLISVPPVPSRDITPQDVYNNVKRLNEEVSYLLKTKTKIYYKSFSNKTPSDVYRELWIISIGFDGLIGQGFSPTDVYAQTEQIIATIKFLRQSQHEKKSVALPPLKTNQHPNHAFYKSVALIKKIQIVERKLWMSAVPIPKVEEKVISPTEVYDSLQTVIAELNRISRRLGIERSFTLIKPKGKKTPADVVQNLEYAIRLLPSFSFTKELNQYPKSSLIKTPNDVFALSKYILQKIEYIKREKGIKTLAKETSYIYGLKPIHVYEKGIEDLEKIAKLKKVEGFSPSQIPSSATKKISPSEVYELILRLDDELSLIYADSFSGDKTLNSYRELLYKTQYKKKTSSDVYDNLWKISYELDAILNEEYTPNETYILAKEIQNNLLEMQKFFLGKVQKVKYKKFKSKKPSDVFFASIIVLKKLESIKRRSNLKSAQITIPKDEIITPTSVYNTLRIISATISEINVYYNIPMSHIDKKIDTDKTPTDVYSLIYNAQQIVSKIMEENSYEN